MKQLTLCSRDEIWGKGKEMEESASFSLHFSGLRVLMKGTKEVKRTKIILCYSLVYLFPSRKEREREENYL